MEQSTISTRGINETAPSRVLLQTIYLPFLDFR